MSDLEILLEEIEALQSAISSALYKSKSMGHIPKLEKIALALGECLDAILTSEEFKDIHSV